MQERIHHESVYLGIVWPLQCYQKVKPECNGPSHRPQFLPTGDRKETHLTMNLCQDLAGTTACPPHQLLSQWHVSSPALGLWPGPSSGCYSLCLGAIWTATLSSHLHTCPCSHGLGFLLHDPICPAASLQHPLLCRCAEASTGSST